MPILYVEKIDFVMLFAQKPLSLSVVFVFHFFGFRTRLERVEVVVEIVVFSLYSSQIVGQISLRDFFCFESGIDLPEVDVEIDKGDDLLMLKNISKRVELFIDPNDECQ
jgi:hypothetical protein